MAQITINEISKNYTYSAGNISFCSVALPITACWGHSYEDPAALGKTEEEVLESTVFQHFPSTAAGLDAFNAEYRGPAANYRSANDFSYQVAISLLAAGYDIDVCRVCSGAHASASFTTVVGEEETPNTFTVRAKHPGSFGNNLYVTLVKPAGKPYWNLIVYIVDSMGGKSAVENLTFVFDIDNSTDAVPHISEVTSSFITFVIDGVDSDTVTFTANDVRLTGGTDRKQLVGETADSIMGEAITLATARFTAAPGTSSTEYVQALTAVRSGTVSVSKASAIRYREWNFNAAMKVIEILTDKLAYASKRLIMPGWDDQDFLFLTGETKARIASLSPLHARMMDVASIARCMTALIDIPRSLERSGVWNDSPESNLEGYTQKVARYLPTTIGDASDGLFSTHSATFGPWCQYKYAGMSRAVQASPSFLKLLMDISMIRNQSAQYEWILPQNRQHDVVIGDPDYRVPKRLLDVWQSNEGASLNVMTVLPDSGMTCWGNSTAYEVPVATYNALQNLSTRYLINAIKDVVFRAGVAITFQYNNEDAYSSFYAACSPILDTMFNQKAIAGYHIEMSKDINALDSVQLNSVIGKITVYVNDVINDVTVDLIAIPSAYANVAAA